MYLEVDLGKIMLQRHLLDTLDAIAALHLSLHLIERSALLDNFLEQVVCARVFVLNEVGLLTIKVAIVH